MKKWKLVSLVLVILLAVACGCGVPKAEVDELLAGLETECEDLLAQQRVQLEADAQNRFQGQLAKQMAELETEHRSQLAGLEATYKSRLAELEAENEHLKAPTPEVSAGIVGTATFEELRQIQHRFFPESLGQQTGSFTKGPYPLVGIETLDDFLLQDRTERFRRSPPSIVNLDDQLAFYLKHNWMQAGLPGHSLSLIKARGMTHKGEILYWLNLFITKENGELAVYRVEPTTDAVTRIEEDPDVLYALVTDYEGI